VDLALGGAFLTHEAKDGSMGFDFAGTYTKDRRAQAQRVFVGTDGAVELLLTEWYQRARNLRYESTHSIEQQRAAGWPFSTTSLATSRPSGGV